MDELNAGQTPIGYELIDPGDGSLVLALTGDLDISTSERLDVAVRDAIAAVSTRLVVDLRDLHFADSSAIALWVRWSHTVPKLELRNPQPIIRRVIETMGLTEVLHPS